MKIFVIFISITLAISSCAQSDTNSPAKTSTDLDSLQTAYFASGCFWCSEAIFETIGGISEVESGYAGGSSLDPTYGEVCSGGTGHAETVKIYYDSSIVDFATLVDVFFNSHDPSTINQQGPDSGTQYRSIAFYENAIEKSIIQEAITKLKEDKVFSVITTKVEEFSIFYIAEDAHQNYVKNNLKRSYVQNVSKPRMQRFLEKMPSFKKSNPFDQFFV